MANPAVTQLLLRFIRQNEDRFHEPAWANFDSEQLPFRFTCRSVFWPTDPETLTIPQGNRIESISYHAVYHSSDIDRNPLETSNGAYFVRTEDQQPDVFPEDMTVLMGIVVEQAHLHRWRWIQMHRTRIAEKLQRHVGIYPYFEGATLRMWPDDSRLSLRSIKPGMQLLVVFLDEMEQELARRIWMVKFFSIALNCLWPVTVAADWYVMEAKAEHFSTQNRPWSTTEFTFPPL